MRFRKCLSVFLVAVMLMGVMSLGFTGMAAEIKSNVSYTNLAEALKSEYVSNLANYEVESFIPENPDGSYYTSGFNTEARSFTYVHKVVAKDNAEGAIAKAAAEFFGLATRIMSDTHGIGCYDAKTLIAAVSEELKATKLFSLGVKDEETGIWESEWDYYNVETILRYFLGNVAIINAGNWFHSFSFEVTPSIDSKLENGLDNADGILETVKYELAYRRVYDDKMSRAYYSFDAYNYLVSTTTTDITETINDLKYIKTVFDGIFAESGWDRNVSATDTVKAAAEKFEGYTTKLSDNALKSAFGDQLINMVIYTNLLKDTDDMPKRTIVGTSGGYTVNYVANSDILNGFIREFDSFFSPETDEEKDLAKRAAMLVKTVFGSSEFIPSDFSGEYASLGDIANELINSYLYTDAVVSALVEAVYSSFAALGDDHIATLLSVATTPSALADMLDDKYLAAKTALGNAVSWKTVDYSSLTWGVNNKESFIAAVCDALCGVQTLLDVLMGSGDIVIAEGFTMPGQNLYNNLIVRLFNAIGATEYDVNYSSAAVINTLISWITDTLLANPFATALSIVPVIAAAFSGEKNAIENVLEGVGFTFTVGEETETVTLEQLLPAGTLSVVDSFDSFIKTIFRITYIDNSGAVPQEKVCAAPAIPEEKLASLKGATDANAKTLVLLARYVFTALGYRETATDKTLAECLDIKLDVEFIGDKTVEDFITSIMLHPDEVFCAIVELVYSSENLTSKDDVYPVTEIDYHNDELLVALINPTFSYGTPVKYSEYWTKEAADELADTFEPLLEAIFLLLGVEGMQDGIGAYIKNTLRTSIFTNETINTLFNSFYQFLADYNLSSGMDVEEILYTLFGISCTPESFAASLDTMLGAVTEASVKIREAGTWEEIFRIQTGADGEADFVNVNYDWGLDSEDRNVEDKFFRIVSVLFTPVSFIFRNIFLDENLSLFGLMDIPGYAGYQNAYINLLETLKCPDILTYKEYSKAAAEEEANVIYNLLAPFAGLLKEIYKNPTDTILQIIPNFLFFVSIGGFNDLVNNFLHSAYVMTDILSPIVDVKEILDDFLAGIDIQGLSLNLSLPFDVDFNVLVTDFVDKIIGETITVEGETLIVPEIDLYTLCVGEVVQVISKDGRKTVHLKSSKGEQLTLLLRTITEFLFIKENHSAFAQMVVNMAGEGRLDDYDAETLVIIFDKILGLVEDYQVLDIVLFVSHLLATNIVPIADTLSEKLGGGSIGDILDFSNGIEGFVEKITGLLGSDSGGNSGEVDDIKAATSIFERIGAFFERIMNILMNLITSIFPFLG